ncbi:MAG TPA: hypothetical protein VHB77_20975 [Planctomycetaceae bacterium]|nr:hypothetical protein [Planctomycetaceae bacterium]
MEGLLLLIAGFIAPYFAAVLAIGGELVALFSAILCNFVLTVMKVPPLPPRTTAKPARKTAAPPPPAPVPITPSRRYIRRAVQIFMRASAVVFVLTLLASYVLNAMFFEETLRWIFSGIQRQTGIETTFRAAQGNLWSGLAGMSHVRIRRQDHPHSNFDLSVDELLIDVSVLRLWQGKFALQEFSAQDVQGKIEWLEAVPEESRRPFRIDRADLKRVDVKWTDRTRGQPIEARLEVDEFRCAAFRSNWAAFDTLFRGTTSGRISGQPFSIESQAIEGGRQTRWKADALPANVVAPYLGGPFRWMAEGKVDLDVTDRWQVGDIDSPRFEDADIDMDWKLVFRELKISPPPDASVTQRKLGEPIAKFLTAHGDRVALGFEFSLKGRQFAGRVSIETAGLLKDLAQAAAAALAKKVAAIGK